MRSVEVNMWKVINGNNIDILKTYEDNSFDAIVTDPPYGIAFLGKDWDSKKATETTSKLVALSNLPSGMKHTSLADDLEFQYWMRDIFLECNRVLKPGGHLLAFSAARTYHHMAMAAQTAGFEIRDQLMWLYGSGFPKAQKIDGFDGWKTALKPAHEPIVMARKPLAGTHKQNMEQWGVGALNIDASRIPAQDKSKFPEGEYTTDTTVGSIRPTTRTADENTDSRFPSNVLGEVEGYQKFFYCPKVSRSERHAGFDVKIENTRPRGEAFGDSNLLDENKTGNNHPTVKPVELMKYLIKLVTPKGGKVLDPFNGSGSTGMAAVELGYDYVGCELDPDYVEIANKRIAAWEKKFDTPAHNLFDVDE